MTISNVFFKSFGKAVKFLYGRQHETLWYQESPVFKDSMILRRIYIAGGNEVACCEIADERTRDWRVFPAPIIRANAYYPHNPLEDAIVIDNAFMLLVKRSDPRELWKPVYEAHKERNVIHETLLGSSMVPESPKKRRTL